MAIITTNNAEVVSVYGVKGFRCKTVETDYAGQERTTYIKVWGAHSVEVGDFVNVAGNLSTRVEEAVDQDGNPKLDREGKQIRYAAIHINDPIISVITNAPF
jgi:phage FluMu protein Com